MQKKIFGGLIVFLIGMFIFASCAKDTVQYEQSAAPIDTTLKLSFKDTIQPIFTASCLGSSCHAGTIPPDLSVGKAYNSLTTGGFVNTANPPKSEIYLIMKPGGGMSQHCTEAEANLVLNWIAQGAKDN
ncbi:MAG: hypothetical protein NTU98_07445 [Bacteroidetes bacterium]|nr:hypothetical protein [Bacteroidota bacterium]